MSGKRYILSRISDLSYEYFNGGSMGDIKLSLSFPPSAWISEMRNYDQRYYPRLCSYNQNILAAVPPDFHQVIIEASSTQ